MMITVRLPTSRRGMQPSVGAMASAQLVSGPLGTTDFPLLMAWGSGTIASSFGYTTETTE